MQKEVIDFFEKYIDTSRPVLLGLSGGADSMCLFHLLLQWNKVQVHIVHIDHGWRKESLSESKILEALAGKHKLEFFQKRLDPIRYKGNLENESRKERYAFFSKVAEETNAQGILLGHHADDVQETVLKRVLEGAKLTSLATMKTKLDPRLNRSPSTSTFDWGLSPEPAAAAHWV